MKGMSKLEVSLLALGLVLIVFWLWIVFGLLALMEAQR